MSSTCDLDETAPDMRDSPDLRSPVSPSSLDDPHDVERLLEFSESVVASLRLADGLYCFDKPFGSLQLRGRSVRYSMMVLLGLSKRLRDRPAAAGQLAKLHGDIHRERASLGVGDLGLLLWADTRLQSEQAMQTLSLLEDRSLDTASLGDLEGMEAAWFLIGAIEALRVGLPCAALVDRALQHLLSRKSRRSPLFRHTAGHRGRALLPNFATEIYTLLALTEAARDGLHPPSDAVALADLLIESRDADGGWPWLFHAEDGTVVERYEIYSVHQDAMAPMALFALTEVTGSTAYAAAAVESFAWGFGRNDLGHHFYDVDANFAHRSVRRQGWAHRAGLVLNTAAATTHAQRRFEVGNLEINTTCRPYHLGWVMEAWSGREHLHSLRE